MRDRKEEPHTKMWGKKNNITTDLIKKKTAEKNKTKKQQP